MGDHRRLKEPGPGLPPWLPDAAKNYLLHTERGVSIRALARRSGCHASTVLRQVRRLENRRDDPLIDRALTRLGGLHFTTEATLLPHKDTTNMTAPIRPSDLGYDDAIIEREARRILRRLSESGAVLAVAAEMEKAVVVRDLPGGATARTAVVERQIAEAMALREWIACRTPGRIARYEITSVGRAALKRLLAAQPRNEPGFAEAQTPFADQHRDWAEKPIGGEAGAPARRMRYNAAESPLALLARRKGRDGKPYLSDDLVMAGERLREDFELAQMGPRVAQNWEKFLTGGDRGSYAGDSGVGDGPAQARTRVSEALRELGPGLGDVVLRCCCFLEGMEAAEKRMGWSARSGKVVLRIALQRLKRHYELRYGKFGPMIG